MDTIMITGSTGFIGAYLTDQLLEEGYDLRLLVRTPSKARTFEERGATLIKGDLTDGESIARAMDGADGVIHLAAVYRLGGDPEWMQSVNVDGTEAVLDEAQKQNIERILYCGSDTSLGDTGGIVQDESATHDGDFRSNYARTKHEAHQLVNERINQGQPIVHAIVSSVYGPGDDSPIASLITNYLAGHALAVLDQDAGYTFTYVDDVASGLLKAYEKGTPGEEYLLSGEPATFEEFFETLREETGIPATSFELSDSLVDAVIPVLETVSTRLGSDSSGLEEIVSMGRNVTRFFSGDKAREELNWNPRSLQEGVRKTLPWFGQKEYEQSRELLDDLKVPLTGLCIFDIGLGMTASLLPNMYKRLIHGAGKTNSGDPQLLQRTGTLWLVFAGVQGIAAGNPEDRPGWVMATGVLRLMDVPADPVYYADSRNLTSIGRLGLLSAPVFNLLAD